MVDRRYIKNKAVHDFMRKNIMTQWEKTWNNFQGRKLNFIARTYMQLVLKKIIRIIKEYKISQKSKIIDVGCGTGRTILWFKKIGYKNIIGIDASASSIKYCHNIGLNNVFLKDAFKTNFRNFQFDLVFSEGLVEHFDIKDFDKLIDEMCRISNKYVLLVQPNRWSLYRKLVNVYYSFFKEKGPPEKDYALIDFYRSFAMNRFYLEKIETVILGGFWILLFRRCKNI